MNDSNGLGEVTVKTQKLIEIVVRNRDAHRAVFEKAIEQYRDEATAALNERIDEVKRSGHRPVALYFSLPLPEEHTADYDRALKMLQMHVADTVALSEEAAARLVDDDWGWQQSFAKTTQSYAARNYR